MVALTGYHFGCSVARRSTRSLKSFAVPVSVRKTKIYYLNALVVIKQQILRLQVAMYNVKFVKILDSSNDLVEESLGKGLPHTLVLNNEVKQLAARRILHNQVQLLGCLDNLIQLNDVGVADHLEDMNLSCHALHVVHVRYLVLFEYFHRHFFAGEIVHSHFHFSERALADSLRKQVVAHVARTQIRR